VSVDPLAQFKEDQKHTWTHFAPFEAQTVPPAARLVKHARVQSGQRVLDVACGTGVVAITAARAGARATGLDLTPALLSRARENAALAEVDIDWHEGDVEQLPFADATFDAVLSQFGHMFAPRPLLAVGEMLRVLKPGGTIAFSTWPAELLAGRRFALIARYMPPPPPEVTPPPLWGDPLIVRDRLGSAVTDITFARGAMHVAALSVQHYRANAELASGPTRKLVEALSANDPARLAAFRRDVDAMVTDYFEDNIVRQDYLMTRATKI
jgi:SAM-dependent methyltransferase